MNRPQIKAETYLQRVKKMQELARANDYDVIIIAADEAEPANVRYFTGYVPVFETTAIMIPAEGEATLLIGPESEALTKKTSRIANYEKLLEFRETSDPEYPDLKYSTFAELIAALKNIKRIGIIGANVMTVQVYLGILEGANGAEICRCDNLLRSMRMIKTPEEIEVMRYTAQIAQRGFESAIGNIAPGMTEHQVIAEFVHAIMKEGAECTGFPFWCVSGSNSNQAIGKSSYKQIEKNEIIQITMGASYEGYVASFGRPISFGKPSDAKAYELLSVGLEANKLTHKYLAPGIKACEIVEKVHGYVRDAGYGEYIVYGPGHGTGMMECEYPFIESTSDYIIQPGMTFAVDTFLGGPDFGMRYEDAAAVTETGELQLSRAQQEIIIL